MSGAGVKNFALVGVAGFVAPKHLHAIRATGNRLIAATDPHDSVGVLDSYFPEARYFREIERFDRHLEKLRRGPEPDRLHYLSICSPNYLHDAHVRLALRLKAHAICEKPLVLSPWNLDQLAELEQESGRRVFTTLQLRCNPRLVALKRQLEASSGPDRADVVLTYVTRRGPWYHVSWKGDEEKSGGIAMNLGIHFFDLLLWLFGPVETFELHLRRPDKMAGSLELERARVSWFLSVDGSDVPAVARVAGQSAYRTFTLDGEEIDLTSGFGDLHTRLYEEVLAGTAPGITEARPAVELGHRLRRAEISVPGERAHPAVRR